jgi:D-aminopeptidase
MRSRLIASAMSNETDEPTRCRIRDLGVQPGTLNPGPLNAITDVIGVRVGHCTIIEGDSIRTGVTAIVPHPRNLYLEKVPAAVHIGNGFGKAAGFLQVQELGTIETPIVLTNTLAVGRAIEGVVRWTLQRPGNEKVTSVNAVVGETNDSYLNDIRAMRISVEDVIAAIDAAKGGPVEEGSVGAGTGTRCFGFKGGIGTASRVLAEKDGGFVVGTLVQSNFGGSLMIDGVRVGERLAILALDDQRDTISGGSCMIVIATDAPLCSRNLQRLASRGMLGLARTGSVLANGSGDFAIAFSTRNLVPHSPGNRALPIDVLPNDAMTPLFQAAVEAVEEAVYNSLTMARTMTGHKGRTAEALSIELLREMLISHRGD